MIKCFGKLRFANRYIKRSVTFHKKFRPTLKEKVRNASQKPSFLVQGLKSFTMHM